MYVFDVHVVAMLYGRIEEFEQRLQLKQVTTVWHQIDLEQPATAWVDIAEHVPEGTPIPNHESDIEHGLPNCFDLRLLIGAPAIIDLKKEFVNSVGTLKQPSY